MKGKMVVAASLVVIASGCSAGEKKAPSTDQEKISYSMGYEIGANVKKQFTFDIDADSFARGIKAAVKGEKAALSEDEMNKVMMTFQKQMLEKQQSKLKEAVEKNGKEGEAFLAANAKKEGVKTLPSGLQYKVLKEDRGPKPKSSDTVVVKYRGALLNGTEFDSTKDKTADVPVGKVIPGWMEALQLMPAGSKWQVFIPAKLAYGEKGAGPIPPNSTLVFDIELVSIK